AEDGIADRNVTGVQTCALPIYLDGGGQVSLSCQGAVVFPRGRVALAPAVSGQLHARQEQVVEALAETGADLHHNYARGRWLPHRSEERRVGKECREWMCSVEYR